MPEQLLDRQHVGVLVAHHGHVVEPVHVADRLVERLALGELLGAAMQKPDVRVGLLDDLAVHLEHQAQHAVRRRMLRAEVHGVVAYLSHRACRTAVRRRHRRVGERGIVAVVVADHLRHEHARLDAHRLIHHARASPGRSAPRRCRSAGKSLRNGWPMKP